MFRTNGNYTIVLRLEAASLHCSFSAWPAAGSCTSPLDSRSQPRQESKQRSQDEAPSNSREEHSMDQNRSRLKLSENFERPIGPYQFRGKSYGPIIGPYLFLGRLVWTNGPESSSKVSPYTGIGPWMAIPRVQGCQNGVEGESSAPKFQGYGFSGANGHKWETDFLPLLVLTRRGRSTGKNQYW